MNTCLECDKKVLARGLCGNHYMQKRRAGLLIPRKKESDAEYIANRVKITGDGPCGSEFNAVLGPLPARWYCVSNDGMATLCKDQEDAQANARHCDLAWPKGSPHRAVLLGDVAAERAACAHAAGDYARKWWSRHSATNKHMTTTREAHEDFCALQRAILRA